MLGVPIRENSSLNTEYISLIVPTVERAFPPSRLWSTTTNGLRLSIISTFGLSYFGSLPRIQAV